MPWYANEQDELADGMLAEWMGIAHDHVDDIGVWRDHDDKYYNRGGWPDPPDRLLGHTQFLTGWITVNAPQLNPAILEHVYAPISLWYADQSAEHLPPQSVLETRLDRASILVNAARAVIHNRLVDTSTVAAQSSERSDKCMTKQQFSAKELQQYLAAIIVSRDLMWRGIDHHPPDSEERYKIHNQIFPRHIPDYAKRPINRVIAEARRNGELTVLDPLLKDLETHFKALGDILAGYSPDDKRTQVWQSLNAAIDELLKYVTEPPADANQQDVVVRAGADADRSAGGDAEADRKTDWRDVRDRLERMRKQGEKYTSQADLAKRVRCAKSTISKAIRNSPKLAKWMDKSRKDRAAPGVTELNEVVADNARQETEVDPSDVLTGDDVDTALARLIGQAKPEERAQLNALDDEKRRAMARLYYAQQRDEEPSPLDDDPPGRRAREVKHHKQV